VCERLTLLVLWPREGSKLLTVGRGCFAEVADARKRGIPIIAVTSKGRFFDIAAIEESGLGCCVCWGYVTLGDEVT
jgi:hypothetical protein